MGYLKPCLRNHEGGGKAHIGPMPWRLVSACTHVHVCLRGRGEAERNRERILHGFGSEEICGLGSVTRVCEYGTPERGGSVYTLPTLTEGKEESV